MVLVGCDHHAPFSAWFERSKQQQPAPPRLLPFLVLSWFLLFSPFLLRAAAATTVDSWAMYLANERHEGHLVGTFNNCSGITNWVGFNRLKWVSTSVKTQTSSIALGRDGYLYTLGQGADEGLRR